MADNVLEEERRRENARLLAQVHARPDGLTPTEQVGAGFAQPQSPGEVQAFGELEPTEPQPFSRDGRDFYVKPDGKLMSFEAGFDPATDYPGLAPATSEQVAERDLQKRKGGGWDKFDAVVETGLRTLAGAESLASRIATMDPRSVVSPFKYGQGNSPTWGAVEPDQLAPELYTRESIDKAAANPKSAMVGAFATDLALSAAAPGGLARTAMTGALGASSDAALTGAAPKMSDVAYYGAVNNLLEGVGSYAWGEAMRSLGKKKSSLDRLTGDALDDALRDAVRETDPVLQADKLRANAGPIIEQSQVGLDQAVSTIEERMAGASDRMFTPGMLRKTVSENAAAQAERVGKLATQLDHAATVTGDAAVDGARALLADALEATGPKQFGALREASKALAAIETRSPLIDEAAQAIEDALGDQTLWGRAAKQHAELEQLAGGAGHGSGFSVEDLAQREELDFALEQARKVASATGDKALLAAVREAESHIATADRALGAKLMGPELPAPGAPAPALSLGQKLIKGAVGRSASAAVGRVAGMVGGGIVGGVPGSVGGAVLGDVLGHAVAPLVERAGNYLARVPKTAAERTAQGAGKRWTASIYSWAKEAARRHPTKIIGAGLLAGSALSDDQEQGTAAASVGLLAFFLPKGGRAALARELAGAVHGMSAAERLAARNASQHAAEEGADLLYRYARGERNYREPGGAQVRLDSPEAVFEAQHRRQLQAYVDALGVGVKVADGYNPLGEFVPQEVAEVLKADLRARNAALVETDGFLHRLAVPGRLEALPAPKERTSLDVLERRAQKAFQALKAGDMPAPILDRVDYVAGGLREGNGVHIDPDQTARTVRRAIDSTIEEWERHQGPGPTRRGIEYIDAKLSHAAEEARIAMARDHHGYRRSLLRAAEPPEVVKAREAFRAVQALPREVGELLQHYQTQLQRSVDNPELSGVDRYNVAAAFRDDFLRTAREHLPDSEMAGAKDLYDQQVTSLLDSAPGARGPEPRPDAARGGTSRPSTIRDQLRSHIERTAHAMSPSDRGQMVRNSVRRYAEEVAAHTGHRPSSGELREAEAAFQETAERTASRHGLHAVSGEGAGPEPGAAADFRRLGLPEPQQPSEVPIQMKLGLEPPVRIQGDPQRSPGDPTMQRRAAQALERVQRLPEDAFPVEAQEHFRRYQTTIRDTMNLRLMSESEIAEMGERAALRVSAESPHPPLHPDVQEFIKARLEEDALRYRGEQLRAEPHDANERSQMAFNQLRDGDMPGLTHERLEVVTRDLRGSIRHDLSPEELTARTREALQKLSDRFEVDHHRPPNARERAYLESHLAHEGAERFGHELRLQSERERGVRLAQKAERQREIDAKLQRKRTAAEDARVSDLMDMGGLEQAEERQATVVSRMEDAIRALNVREDYVRDAGVAGLRPLHSVDDVIAHMRAGGELSPGEEIWARDQMAERHPPALEWLRGEVDELARMDTDGPGDSIELHFDDLLHNVTHERGRPLTPWEEFHVRREWEANERDLTRRHESKVEELRDERHPPESEHDYDDAYGGHGYANGLPDPGDLSSIGIDEVNVEHADGVHNVFGQDLSLHDVKEVFALEELDAAFPSAQKTLTINRDDVTFSAEGGGVSLQRTFQQDSQGLYIYHDHFFIRAAGKQGQGAMKKIFRSAVPAYERLGAHKVKVSCAEIGCYVWPSLGFRGSPGQEANAIASFRRFTRGTHGIALNEAEYARLDAELETLRDVADATVPVDLVRDHFPQLEERYRGTLGHSRNVQDFEEAFVKDGRMKLGKFFLITQHGDWNSGLVLKLDRDSDWYREFLSRIGLMSAGGVGFKELVEAWGSTPQQIITQPDEDAPAEDQPAEDIAPSEAEHAARSETHARLDYLRQQSKSLTTTTARALTSPDVQKTRTVASVPGVTHSAGVAHFMGRQATLRGAFEEKRDTFKRLEQEPLALVDEMAAGLSDIGDAAPELHRELVAKTYEVVAFLKDKLPGNVGQSMVRPEGSPPTDTALRQFALYYSAATNPSSVLTDLANNRVRREQVDTLKQLWPETYTGIEVAISSELAAGRRPSLGQRTRLGLLGLDFNGALDRAFSPRLLAALSEYRESQPESPQAGRMPNRRTQPSIAGASPLAGLQKGAAGSVGLG